MDFDINHFKPKNQLSNRYEKRINLLEKEDRQIEFIETAVKSAIDNIHNKNTRSFVIYGEPQSGKTEMMIALTAKLLDQGYKIIIHLLNDSVDLLGQNLRRFKHSGLAPAPKEYKDILDPKIQLTNNEWILFCKKNSRDLQKLLDKLGHITGKVIIDDEADYASPNAKVNRGEKTKINELIGNLLEDKGIYIGVTATPARLDLNNTFENDHEQWVDFPPHTKYTGQDVFFPINSTDPGFGFNLQFLSDTGDDPKYIREALFRFMVNVAYLNLYENKNENNYSILIHTSGKRADHRIDKEVVDIVLGELNDHENPKYEKHIKALWDLAKKKYPGKENKVTSYLAQNTSRYDILLLNSDRHNPNLEEASNPASLFTIVIGGNIVSRGITFNNLLSMFFTRDVKHKIQQDTYIQRARMFGSRGDYLKFFELTIPETLYADWHKCFVFHRLAIEAVREGKGAPVWLSDHRVNPVATSSIDRSTVSFDKGEMAFALFDFDQITSSKYEQIISSHKDNLTKINELRVLLGDAVFPEYLESYITNTCFKGAQSVAAHPATSIAGYKDEPGINKEKIERLKGFFGRAQMQKDKYPEAIHHLKIFYNGEGKARLFYKFDGSIQFIKNLKSDIERKAA